MLLAAIAFSNLTPPVSTVLEALRAGEAAYNGATSSGVAVWWVGELAEGGDERPGEVLSPARFRGTSVAADMITNTTNTLTMSVCSDATRIRSNGDRSCTRDRVAFDTHDQMVPECLTLRSQARRADGDGVSQ